MRLKANGGIKNNYGCFNQQLWNTEFDDLEINGYSAQE